MAYLTDVLERIVSGRTKQNELQTLLPWNWTASRSATITGHASARSASAPLIDWYGSVSASLRARLAMSATTATPSALPPACVRFAVACHPDSPLPG